MHRFGGLFFCFFVVSFLNPKVDFLRKPLKTSIRLALGRDCLAFGLPGAAFFRSKCETPTPPAHTVFSPKKGAQIAWITGTCWLNPHGVLVFLVVTLLFCDLFLFHCFSLIPTVCGRIGAIFSVLFFAICLNQNIDFLINSLKTSSGSAFFALGGDLGHSS